MTLKPTIVLTEDDAQIRRFVRAALESADFLVHEAETAQRGLIELGTRKPDLLILDLGLPDRDGLDVIRDLRAWSSLPILILSARSLEGDKIDALDAGADDYLVKPFGVGELLARVRAMLRRRAQAGAEPQSCSTTRISFRSCTCPASAAVARCSARPISPNAWRSALRMS